jgi:uncharacterized protein (TIGR03435 family)
MSRQIPGAIHCAIGVGIAIALSIHAQTAKPKFEVASVKPCAPNTTTGTLAGEIGPDSVRYHCRTLIEYVRDAYDFLTLTKVRNAGIQVEKGPPWANRDRYDISAKSGSPMKRTAVAEMMQSLLEDRFKLKVHRETRAVPAYALMATKGGIRLPVAKTECFTWSFDEPLPVGPERGQPFCGEPRETQGGIQVHGSTMADFCLALSNLPLRLYRPIFVDNTGVKGRFDFDLKFPPADPAEPGAAARPPYDFIQLLDALRPLGLELRDAKGTDEVLVIDHAELPTPN